MLWACNYGDHPRHAAHLGDLPNTPPPLVDHGFTPQAVHGVAKANGKIEHAIGDLTTKIDQQDISGFRERLAKVEARLGSTATSKDMTALEATLIKWTVATGLTVTVPVVAAVKLPH